VKKFKEAEEKLCEKDQLAVMKQCQMDQRKPNPDSAATIAGQWCIDDDDDDDGGDLIDLEDPRRPRHSEIQSAL